MTEDRDPFLADQLGRTTPPDHGPTFWADLEEALNMTTDTRTPFTARDWRPPRLLATAAVLIVLAGLAAGLIAARGGGEPTGIETGDPASSDGEVPPSPETATAPDRHTSSTASTTTIERAPLDLAAAVELITSLDGSLRLLAVPDPDELGCEGLAPVWRLYWADSDDMGYLASDYVFANTPTLSRGDDGRLAFLDRCEESTMLLVAAETEPGALSTLKRLRLNGWEDAAIQEVTFQTDSDIMMVTVSRQGPSGELELHRLEVDGLTGAVLSSEPVDPGEEEPPAEICSAQDITDPVLNSGQPWSDVAAAIQQAALACDYEAVAELAGPDFVSSFGAPGDFAEQLRTDEDFGYEPMKKLVLLLEAEPGWLQDGIHLAWPAFFACEETCGMDEDEIRRIGYSDEDIALFRDFGAYIGYRVLFAADDDGGYTWTGFVAGD